MLYVYYAEEFPGRMEINRITVEAETEDIAKRLAAEYIYAARGKVICDATVRIPEVMSDGGFILNGHIYENAKLLISNVPGMFYVEWFEGHSRNVVSSIIKATDIGEAIINTAYVDAAAENRVLRAFPLKDDCLGS